MFFKNGKNVYNVLKLCIFYKSIINKKMYYFYIIFILNFLLILLRYSISYKVYLIVFLLTLFLIDSKNFLLSLWPSQDQPMEA